MYTNERPSGATCGNQLLNGSLVSWVGDPPSPFMRQICILPLRVELK